MNNDTLSGTPPKVNCMGGDLSQEPDPRRLARDELAAYLHARTTVSVPFAGACCGISRSASYAAARDGSLKTLRLGHRSAVPDDMA